MTEPWTPHSIEAEQGLLGASLMDARAIQAVEQIVSADDFYEPLHAHLWGVLVDLSRAGKASDMRLVIGCIGADAKIPLAGMDVGQYIARLASEATTIINAPDFAALVRDYADQRRIANIGAGLKHDTKVDPVQVATAAIDQLDSIIASRANTATPSLTMPQALARAVDWTAAAYQRDGKITGITTGLDDLDNITLGMQRGELIVLAGRPGMGKTAIGLTITRRAAGAGAKSGFFSLEMGDVMLTQRILSDVMYGSADEAKPITYWQLRKGSLSEQDFERMTKAAMRLQPLPIRIEQRPGLTVAQIAGIARQWKRREGLDLIVVDHLHLIRPSDRYRGNRVNEIGETTAALKALAKELDCAVLALCQLSRVVESREEKKPTLADLRGSGDIEQDADTVIMLYREAYYLERAKPPETDAHRFGEWIVKLDKVHNTLLAIIEKQRNGPIGQVELFCHISCNAIRNRLQEERLPTAKNQRELL